MNGTPASLQPVIENLTDWRLRVLDQLKDDIPGTLNLKLALDRAIRLLQVCESHAIPQNGSVVVLPVPADYQPFGEYRIVWDGEVEQRELWQEVARALPGDIVIRRRD